MRPILALTIGETALAVAGLATAPHALAGNGWLGLVGVAVAQAACVLLGRHRALRPAAVRTGLVVGAVAGGLYGLEGLAEYLSPAVTGASTVIGYVIVAGLVASNIVAAAVATARTGQFRDGFTAAVANAVTEYLVWYPTVLGCYYLFSAIDTSRVERVWRAEGTYDDFARSGMTDLKTFVIQDFWGAGFFHLVAGLVLALAFGSAAAGATRLLSHRTVDEPSDAQPVGPTAG